MRQRRTDPRTAAPSPASDEALGVSIHRVKVRDAIRLLEADGWRLDRQRGSHRVFRHESRPGTVTVAGKPSADTRLGLWRRCAGKQVWISCDERVRGYLRAGSHELGSVGA